MPSYPLSSATGTARSTLQSRSVPATSAAASIAGWLLTLVLPFTVLWIPVLGAEGTGTLTVLDILLGCLWITTLVLLSRKARLNGTEKISVRIVLYAFAPGFFGCLGAVVFNPATRLVTEFLQHGKRFGFAAIIPLAMVLVPPKFVSRIRIAAMISMIIMVLVPYTPWLGSLPINKFKAQFGDITRIRGTGSLSNPNDYAYVALLVGLIGLSHASRRQNNALSRRCWGIISVSIALFAIIMSASRSGMTAAIIAAAYLIMRSRLNLMKRAAIIAILTATVFIGWRASAVYQDRMESALQNRVLDSSALARIEAQTVAFQTWLHHPLGVGFLNLEAATQEYSVSSQYFTRVGGSDSIYFDHLLATGIFGFLSIIWCFRACWKMTKVNPAPREVSYLKAAMVATFVFATAEISPASMFVGPFFFTVVGVMACMRRDIEALRVGYV